MRQRPGLARAKSAPPFFAQRTVVRSYDARWRDVFGTADTLSEGAIKRNADGVTGSYYGSTSIVVALPEHERGQVLEVARACLHVRLRALRLARREAELRSDTPLGVSQCELTISADPRGLRIDVELEAPLLLETIKGRTAAHHGRKRA